MRKDEAEQTIRKAIPWAKRVSISSFSGGIWIVVADAEDVVEASLILYANAKTLSGAVREAVRIWNEARG